MVANGVFFIRIGVTAWMVLNQGRLSETVFYIFDFASYLLPLAVLELYLRAKDGGGSRLRKWCPMERRSANPGRPAGVQRLAGRWAPALAVRFDCGESERRAARRRRRP